MDNIQILEASEVKLKDYRALRLEALQKEPQAFGSSYEDQRNAPEADWQTWLDNYKKGRRNWMIFAAINKKLIGMLGAFQTDEDVEAKTAQVIAVYVTKEERGKGASKLLLKRLLDKLTNDGQIKKLKLAVNTNQTAAVELYKSFGFEVVGKENMTLGDRKAHEEYLMEHSLR